MDEQPQGLNIEISTFQPDGFIIMIDISVQYRKQQSISTKCIPNITFRKNWNFFAYEVFMEFPTIEEQ